RVPGVGFRRSKCGDLGSRALFDPYAGAVGRGRVDRTGGRRNVEGHSVLPAEERERVGPDLVHDVTVCADAIRAADAGVCHAALDEETDRPVGEQPVWDPELAELPRSEPGSLRPRPRLHDIDERSFSGFVGSADDTQAGAVVDGGKRSGVADGYHARVMWQQRGAVPPHGLAGFYCRPRDAVRLFERVWRLLDQFDSPEEVARGGPGGPDQSRSFSQAALPGGQRRAVGGRGADGGRTSHDHLPNSYSDLIGGATDDVGLRLRQPGLVNQA